MKKINSTTPGTQERPKKEENSYKHSEGITKKLLEKYKPSEAIRALSSARKRNEEQRAA